MVPVTSVPVPAGQPVDGNVVIVHGSSEAPNWYSWPLPPAFEFSGPEHVLSVGQLQ